jgi:hypothetical protein
MTDPLSRVRAIALLLPEAEERVSGNDTGFFVADTRFAQLAGAQLLVLGDAGDQAIELGDGADWTLIEDRIARGWELAAPEGLLEAGGR